MSQDWRAKAKVLNDSLVVYMSTMSGGFQKATPPEKDKMRAEMERRNQELAQFVKASQEKTTAREKELMGPALKKLNAFLKEYAGRKHCDVILGSTQGGNILARGPRLDLTDRILLELNKQYR